MTNFFHDISLGNEELSEINAILEIPKGSQVKYEFDHKTGAIWVDRIGKTPIAYNFNYGDLPQTWNSGDNDPLDVIILGTFPLAVGTIVPCRVIGGLKMIDNGEDDYKIIAVCNDKYYSDIHNIEDIDLHEKEDIEYYLLHYKDLHGKKVELNGWDSKDIAISRLKECHLEYKKKFNKIFFIE